MRQWSDRSSGSSGVRVVRVFPDMSFDRLDNEGPLGLTTFK